MKNSPRLMKFLGFFVPLAVFLGILYIAIEYRSIYVFCASLLALLPAGYTVGNFFKTKPQSSRAPSPNTQSFFSGLTLFYLILISPFVAIVLYSIWALWLSKLF